LETKSSRLVLDLNPVGKNLINRRVKLKPYHNPSLPRSYQPQGARFFHHL
jgi:hypothetical protein